MLVGWLGDGFINGSQLSLPRNHIVVSKKKKKNKCWLSKKMFSSLQKKEADGTPQKQLPTTPRI